MLNGGDIAVNNTTLAANVASFQFADRPGGWGGGIYVDKASKASLAFATIVLNTARFAAGVASNNTVTPLAVCSGGLDQRLKPRPARGGCDVGAFERQPDDVMP